MNLWIRLFGSADGQTWIRQQNRNRSIKRLQAHFEYLRILFHEFRGTLVLIGGILFLGSLLFHFYFRDPQTEVAPDYLESLFRTFVLMSMNFPDTFPSHPVLRLWCFAIPFFSFLVISEAVIRLVILLSSRETSGRRWAKAMTATYRDHIILCGLGRLGYSVLIELNKMGKEVVAIERNENAFGVSEARRMKIPVVLEDACNEEVLRDLDLEKAQAVIAVTDNDMANLEIALDARTLKPDIRVVIRMFDQRIAQKIARSFDIKLIFSPSAIAAPSFAAASVDRTLVNSFYIDDKQLQTIKLLVERDSALIGKPLRFLRDNYLLCILSHRRHNQEANLFPAEDIMLQEQDKVTILGQNAVISQLHALNRNRKHVTAVEG